MKALVVQHMAWECAGRNLLEAAEENGLALEVCGAWHAPLPPLAGFDALIVLGGAPNVDEDGKYPYLTVLKHRIRECVDAGKPYLGFCLGHQLLGNVLGAEVSKNKEKSVGVIEGRLTTAGKRHPLFAGLPARFPMLKWHGMAVKAPLPSGVELLATSRACTVEAIALAEKPQVIGLQFDNHAFSRTDVEKWAAADYAWIHEDNDMRVEEMVAAVEKSGEKAGKQFKALFANFVGLMK